MMANEVDSPTSETEDINDESSDPKPQTKKTLEYEYEPGKIGIKFIFANRDGLGVVIQCEETDTVATVKGSLLSMWPEELENCPEGNRIRLICMGKGFLSPDSRTLEQCEVPVFKTHPTPINVSIKPIIDIQDSQSTGKKSGGLTSRASAGGSNSPDRVDVECCCIVM